MIKESCGVFGIFGNKAAAEMTYLGLFALQHRGEESAGIVTSDGEKLQGHKELGLVDDVFNQERLAALPGNSAIGHVRYSTSGSTLVVNAQPHLMKCAKGQIAIAHNGNIVNTVELKKELEDYGSIFQSSSDSELIIHLMAKPSHSTIVDGLVGAIKRLKGSYSLTCLSKDHLIGIRDPHGFKPLSLGKLGNGWVLSSETCSFDLLGVEFVRDIEPGEVIVIGTNGVKSLYPFKEQKIKRSYCIFEHIYFARPDSVVYGQPVAVVREKLGAALAQKHPVDADVVISVPDSGNFAALGYSKASGIPYGIGFTRNHYVGRTFISPIKDRRSFKVKVKLNPIQELVKGKRLIVVDDSIVRGNTSRSRVQVLRQAGAKEIHLRISCPPHKNPCFYGIDFPNKDELLANRYSVKEIEKYLEVDSLGYLDTTDLLNSVDSDDKMCFCLACFNGDYPVKVKNGFNKFSMGDSDVMV
ncbi:amidophosphoribosyltransferase [Candidatus Omnitrophota bacterium]